MEIGNLMWPDGGSTQAYICCDDWGDLVWEMTEQACSEEGGLKYGTLPCIKLTHHKQEGTELRVQHN